RPRPHAFLLLETSRRRITAASTGYDAHPVGEPSGPPVLAGGFPGGSARDQLGASRPSWRRRLVLHAAGTVSRLAGGGEDGRRPARRRRSGASAPSGCPRPSASSSARSPAPRPPRTPRRPPDPAC